jgi:hypothetical protein
VCDLSYLVQAEAIERLALATMTLAPHMEEQSGILTPAEALREFQEWLISNPEALDMAPEDADLLDLLGVHR